MHMAKQHGCKVRQTHRPGQAAQARRAGYRAGGEYAQKQTKQAAKAKANNLGPQGNETRRVGRRTTHTQKLAKDRTRNAERKRAKTTQPTRTGPALQTQVHQTEAQYSPSYPQRKKACAPPTPAAICITTKEYIARRERAGYKITRAG